MNVCIKRSMAHALSVLMIASALIAGLTAFGTAEKAYADTGLVFTHEGGYELESDDIDSGNPPGPVNGDILNFREKNYIYSINNFYEEGGYDDICTQTDDEYTLERKWNDNQDFGPGKTVYFRYILRSTNNVFSSNDIAVKIKDEEPAVTTLKYEPKTTSRTMDRAVAKSTTPALLNSQFMEAGDKVTVTSGGNSTVYTRDVNGSWESAHSDLDELTGHGNYGLEWTDGETFEGEKAYYHFWVKINGTKVISDEKVEVTLTGDPAPTKTMTAIAFTPVDVYEVQEGKTATPPLPVNGDKITVTYSDDSTEDFTYSENGGASGADFYNENGKSLSQLASDDWESVWSPNQTFNVGDKPTFYYKLGNLKSGSTGVAKIVGKPVPPAEKKVASIEFQHDGKYEVPVEGDPSDPGFTPPATPEPVEGDKIIVTYEDETTETFVYDANSLWTSETTSEDLEDKGTLVRSWNADQKFSPDSTAYFRYSLTVGDDVFKTSDIPVKITRGKPEPKPTPVTSRYTLTFDLNGGEWDGATGIVKWEGIIEGAVIEMPAPKRAGYKFEYWEGSKYYAGQEYTVTEDHTFKAVWTADSGTSGGSSGKGKGVNTGDPNDIAGLLALMLASMVALGAEAVMRWRRSES